MRSKTLHFALFLLIASGGCKARRAITADPTYEDPKGTVEDPGSSDAFLIEASGSSYNFGNKNTGTTNEIELTIVNDGVKDAENIALNTGPSAPFLFKGGSYPGTGGTCPTGTLTSQTSCSIFVEYRPTVGGSFGEVFVLDYESEGVAKTFSYGVYGSAGAASLTVSGWPLYTFSNTLIGAVTANTFTVTNTGSLTARFMTDSGVLAAPFRYKGGVYPGTGGTCATELDAAATCTFVLEFAPTASGISNGSWGMGFVTGGSAGAVATALRGSSGNAVLAITNTPLYTYATTYTGATASRTFTISNTGSFDASLITDLGGLALPFRYAGSVYPGTGGTCAATLAPSGTCTIVVQFVPTLPETTNDTIELSYYDGEQTQTLELDLSGPARGAIIEATVGTTYDFGLVAKNSTNEGTITLRNTGNFAAATITITDTLAGFFRYKGFAYPGTGGSCTTSLAAGASCTMVVEYTPTGSGTGLITSTDNTVIRYNPGSGTLVTTTLTAQGRAGLGTLSFGSGAWGTVVNMSTTERSITVSNGGTFASTLMGVNLAPSSPFSFVGGSYPGTNGGTCGTNLAPGGACTLRLAFAPTVTGVYANSPSLTYFNGATTVTPTLSLSGTSTVAVLGITDFPSYNYGGVAYSSANASRTFTVNNSGGVSATGMTMTGLAAPFTRTGGTCSTTLAAGASCTHIIQFTPTAAVISTDTMVIGYTNGVSAQVLNQDVTGTGLNVAPVANAQSRSFVVDSVANSITLTSSDTNGNSRTYELLTLPSNGSLSVSVGVLGSATLTYTPNPAYTGADAFTFRVNDGLLDSPAATVTLTITP